MIGRLIQKHKLLAILSSATMLAAVFWRPDLFFWGTFIFLLPIFYYACQDSQPITFFDGLLWGCTFWLLHWYGVALVILERGTGTWRIGIFIVLLLYCSFFAGSYFWQARNMSKIFDNIYWVIVSWSATTWLYFYWIRYGLLLPFGLDGYCFANPILPLIEHGYTLGLLHVISSQTLLVVLICLQGALVLFFISPTKTAFLLVVVLIMPFSGIKQMKMEPIPELFNYCAYLTPPHEKHPMDQGQAINQALENLLNKHPKTKIVIMPESSFAMPLNHYDQVTQLWQQNALTEGATLLIGCHRNEDGNRYNCCYCVQSNRVTHLYDKIKLMPFTEYIPFSWHLFSTCASLFMRHKDRYFSRGQLPPRPHYIDKKMAIELRICSELFFATENIAQHLPIPLICLVNDSWFSAPYMRTLMLLFAKLTAIEYQRHLIYVSHYYGVWLTPHGQTLFLAH